MGMSKEQTPIDELRLEIIKHLPNNPDAVFDIMSKANKVTKAKVLEALEREEEFFCENSKINAFRETISNAEWRRLINIHFRRSKKQK